MTTPAEEPKRRRRRVPAPGDTHTYPATSGTGIGWTGLVAVVGLLVAVLVTDRSLQGARWGLALLLGGLAVYAFLVRPKIAVRGRTLVLINPLEDIEVPLGVVDEFQVRSATFVHVGSKRYVGVAIGRKVRHMVRPQSEGMPMGSMMARRIHASAPEPTPRLSTIDLLEERVSTARRDARQLGETEGAVRRQPVWWLISSMLGLAVVLVVLLLL